MLGRHLIKSWSSTQGPISLSSGEAGFYGVVKASIIAIRYQAMMEDLGHTLSVRVWTDSTATIGICGRRGLGRLRHVDTQCLWVQQKVRDNDVELRKVKGELNPADVFTKHLAGEEKVKSMLQLFGCEFRGGRTASAPKLRADANTSPGPLLVSDVVETEAEYLMEWDGREYPAVEYEGEFVVEAYPHHPDMLPHLHEHPDRWFPRAIAVAETKEDEDTTPGFLERRGQALGAEGAWADC